MFYITLVLIFRYQYNKTSKVMKKVILPGITYYEVAIGRVAHVSFNPQDLIIRMALYGISLN